MSHWPGVDLRYIFWDSSLDDLEIEASGGKNADLNAIGGGSSVRYRIRFDWKDQYVIAFGTSFGVTDWLVVRAGFNHGNNPAPRKTASPNAFVIENHFTFGVSLYPGQWDMHFHRIRGRSAIIPWLLPRIR